MRTLEQNQWRKWHSRGLINIENALINKDKQKDQRIIRVKAQEWKRSAEIIIEYNI